MKYLNILFVFIGLLFFVQISANDDSTLFVKTEYHHLIYNGRNTAQKYATRQEMRDSDGVLFREVFYNKETKQVNYVLYYYYNADKSIRLIEKVNDKEKPIGYYIYKYKKRKVSTILEYSYKNNNSKILSNKKFKYKKDKEIINTYNDSKLLLKSEEYNYNKDLLIQSRIIDYLSDSAKNKITNNIYTDTLLMKSTEFIITALNDTNIITKKYIYNNTHKLDSVIITSKNPDYIKYTVYKYFSGGNIENIRTLDKSNYYYDNITYDLRKYYRALPTRKPDF